METKVYNYLDYREYLADYVREKKSSNDSFSYGIFAAKAEISSRGYIKLVIDGKRNLSTKSLPKFIKGLGLNKSESEYFERLVRFNHETDSSIKNDIYKKLINNPIKKKVSVLPIAQHRFYSKWFYPAALEFFLLKEWPKLDFPNLDWIKARFKYKVPLSELKVALNDFISLGLIKKDEHCEWKRTTQFITAPDEKTNFIVRQFQKETLDLAKEALDDPLSDREIRTVTLAVRKEDIPRAKQCIKEFTKNFNFEFSADKEADEVYQMNVQLFGLTINQKLREKNETNENNQEIKERDNEN